MRRLGAVALMVDDQDEAIAFYVGLLGFERIEDVDEGRKRWVTVRPPGAETALVLAVGSDRPPARVAYFLETDDFARDHAAMLAAGVAFEEVPRRELYGTVAVWRDPFGNRWDLIERAASPREADRPSAQDQSSRSGRMVTTPGNSQSMASPATWIATKGTTPR